MNEYCLNLENLNTTIKNNEPNYLLANKLTCKILADSFIDNVYYYKTIPICICELFKNGCVEIVIS